MNSTRANSGFTLLETILALALTGLVVGMLATLAKQWLINWNAGRHNMQLIEMTTLAELRIATDVRHAIPLPSFVNRNGASLFGTTDQIIIVREPDARDHTEHLIVMNYKFSKDYGVIRRTTILNPNSPLDAQNFGDSIVLLPPSFSIKFSYRDLSSHDSDLWQQNAMPASVVVTLKDSNGLFEGSFPIQIYATQPAKCSRVKTYRDCLANQIAGTQIIQGQSEDKSAPDHAQGSQTLP